MSKSFLPQNLVTVTSPTDWNWTDFFRGTNPCDVFLNRLSVNCSSDESQCSVLSATLPGSHYTTPDLTWLKRRTDFEISKKHFTFRRWRLFAQLDIFLHLCNFYQRLLRLQHWGKAICMFTCSLVANCKFDLCSFCRVWPIRGAYIIKKNKKSFHLWKFGRRKNAVGTRAAGECFYSFFEFSQTFTSVSISHYMDNMLFISFRRHRDEKCYFHYQNVNSLCSLHHYVNCIVARGAGWRKFLGKFLFWWSS